MPLRSWTTHTSEVLDDAYQCGPGPHRPLRSWTTHATAVLDHTGHCGPGPHMPLRSWTMHANVTQADACPLRSGTTRVIPVPDDAAHCGCKTTHATVVSVTLYDMVALIHNVYFLDPQQPPPYIATRGVPKFRISSFLGVSISISSFSSKLSKLC